MRSVSRFEAHLMRILHGLLQQAPLEQTLALLSKPLPRPQCLSRDAVALVQDALAKGCVRFLAHHGWMRARHLRAGKIVTGRLWERTPPHELGLIFSKHALEFLLQLASGTLGTKVPKPAELALGDRLLFFLAFDVLRETPLAEEPAKHWLPLYQDGLCRLAFPEELAEGKQRYRIDWLAWTTGQGACILEALQAWLAQRWTLLERKKESIATVARMRHIGATQQRVNGEYLDALAAAQRWDLARCFLLTARDLLQDQPSARRWIRNLDLKQERLADRQLIYQETLALVGQMERLRQWQRAALSVGYFEEEYQASQLWKADWEFYGGEQLAECARAIMREIEPMP